MSVSRSSYMTLHSRLPANLAQNSTQYTDFATSAYLRLGINISVHTTNLLPGRTNIYVIADLAPWVPAIGPSLVGADVVFLGALLQGTLDQLNTTAPSPYTQNFAITPMFVFTSPNVMGFAVYSTVLDADPTRLVVGSASYLYVYTNAVVAKSADVVVTVTDHVGMTFTDAGSGCLATSADQVLVNRVTVLPGIVWSVSIGQCPHYTSSFIASSPKKAAAGAWVGAIVAIAVVAILGVLLTARAVDNGAASKGSSRGDGTRAHWWVSAFGKRRGWCSVCVWQRARLRAVAGCVGCV